MGHLEEDITDSACEVEKEQEHKKNFVHW
jgi:hypothetical protein